MDESEPLDFSGILSPNLSDSEHVKKKEKVSLK
jgi:hypothetical protein